VSETSQGAGGAGPSRPPPKPDLPGLREALRLGARAGGGGRSPRTVLLAVFLLALAVALALAGRALLRSPESVARAANEELARVEAHGWSRVEIVSPRQERRDPETGEVISPFQGFGISVDSAPAGARVLVDGGELGETPLVASSTCVLGNDVEVRVEKAGFRPHRRTVRCRADALVHLEVRLEKVASARR
jgi:hypothetical protein